MDFALPYSIRLFKDLGYVVKGVSNFDKESILIDVVAQPKITLTSIGVGKIVESINSCAEPVVVGSKVVCEANGFSHTEFGIAVKRSKKGAIVESKNFIKSCEKVATAKIDGAFIVACYEDKSTSIYLATYDELKLFDRIYKKARPDKCSIGYKAAACTFEDGRSVIVAPPRLIEVGMPIDVIAYQEPFVYGFSKNWIVTVDVYSLDIRPCIKTKNEVRFVGFIQDLPVFESNNNIYTLEGGSLVKKAIIAGYVSAYGNIVVDDSDVVLKIMNEYGEILYKIPKDSNSKCIAMKDGVACFRKTWIGLLDFNRKSRIHIELNSNGIHKISVNTEIYIVIRYRNREFYVEPFKKIEICDENENVLKDQLSTLEIEHLLGTNNILVESKLKTH